jgi:hypothetical protein
VLRLRVVQSAGTSGAARGSVCTEVSAGRDSDGLTSERAGRREARAVIGAYHEEQLRLLLEHIRSGFARLDAGEIDPFELDDLIHHYKRIGSRAVEVLRLDWIRLGACRKDAGVAARQRRGTGLVASRRPVRVADARMLTRADRRRQRAGG